ncbi:MAG: aminotransferase class I/II-fold pyridoxal phosphate-dependent enzyme [Deltaproteobacteria bacterium]|nr:aminotransferase class I/II-fold pyridoxal phosphate-dependent enzyme [Deltaproteobacteria bacterium]
MKHSAHLVQSRRGRPGDDPIFALNAEANARKAKGEDIVNGTLGALLDDEGRLAVLPSAARAVRETASDEWAPYAPIAGPPAFLSAVIADVVGASKELVPAAIAVATPGGSGALRHAIATFLEPGQALLTTSFHWGPYGTIAAENERRISTFRMFDHEGRFDVRALDAKLGELMEAQGRALLILNDPCNNPTGYSMSHADWARTVEIVERYSAKAPVTVLIDSAYSAFGPERGIEGPLAALAPVMDRALVTVAWSASKTFTHYGLRVGALVAFGSSAEDRQELLSALAFACRGTWSNCNRGGIAAITRLLVDPSLRAAVAAERDSLLRLLGERVAAFNTEASKAGLSYPLYQGGYFVTVFVDDAEGAAKRMRDEGVYVVPIAGGLRVGLCALRAADVERTVGAIVRSTRA